jgi:hypothetical protein
MNDDPTLGRVCSKCDTWLAAAHFRSAPRGRGGLHSICRPCTAKYAREKYAENPELHREASLKWYRNNPEKARLRRRSHTLKANYGLTIEQFDAMLASQGGRCAICRCDEPRGVNWHVDHDHATGKVRAILCHPCNVTLGNVGDSPDLLMAMAAYLLSFQDVLALQADG